VCGSVDTKARKNLEGTADHHVQIFNRLSPISGIVTDSKQQPIAGAIVRISSTPESATSDC